MFSRISSSPQEGQATPFRCDAPSIQKAGQMPCLRDCAFVPSRIEDSILVILPAWGVMVYLLSIREEVHPLGTDESRRGII